MAKKQNKSEGAGVLDELVEVTGVKRKSGESAQDYARRVAMIVDKLPDDDWKEMSEPAQLWVNAAVEAADVGKEIDLPPGLEDDTAGEDAGDDDRAAPAEKPDDVDAAQELGSDEEVEEPAPKSSKSKSKKKSTIAAAPPAGVAEKSRAAKSAPKPAGKKKSAPKPAGKKKSAPKPAGKKIKKTKPASAKAPRAAPSTEPRAGTKGAKMIEMLSRASGATAAEIAKAFDWELHTTRAAISVQVRKAGLKVDSKKDAKRGRVYKIITTA